MTKEQIQEFTLRTTQANHSGLILVLTDIVMVYMTDAKNAFDNDNNIEDYLRNAELAKKSLNELMDCFNQQDKNGRNVVKVLRFIYRSLVTSTVKREPIEYDTCLSLLEKLKVAFLHLHEIDTEGPVMKNTHQVYAGLTYGKGSSGTGYLNESALGVDYSKRGFKA